MAGERFTDTFLWHYLRNSFLKDWVAGLFMLGFALFTGLGRIPLGLILGLFAGILLLLLVLNYAAWLTLGRVLTTREERQSLSSEQCAQLAWNFWMRPMRKPKT